MTTPTKDLAARYDDAVEFESAAWQALQVHEPGSAARAEAWATWAQAISRTNRAWRELNSRTHPFVQPAQSDSLPPPYRC